jgi:hypothetical protein
VQIKRSLEEEFERGVGARKLKRGSIEKGVYGKY